MNERKILSAIGGGLLVLHTLSAATFYVATDGSNSNDGSEDKPFRTVQHAVNTAVAGDTIRVTPGNYGEYVDTRNPGSEGRPVTITAWPPNDPANPVVVKQFNIDQPYTVVEGFHVRGAQSGTDAYFRITGGGSYSLIRSNFAGPGVYMRGTNVTINSSNGTLTLDSGRWTDYGFEVGGTVFLGACSLAPYYYANHDRSFTITALENSIMTLAGSWITETNTRPWLTVFAGSTHDGVSCVEMTTPGPTNVFIMNNTFSNIMGHGIALTGEGHHVGNNVLDRLQSTSGLRPRGNHCQIYSNLFINTERFLFFSSEDASSVHHTSGPDWYDFVAGYVHTAGGPVVSNLIYRNWFQNVAQTICQVSDNRDGRGFYVRSNVFVGVAKSGSISLNSGQFDNNTFYRCSFVEGEFRALAGGGTSSAPATNLAVRWNAFVDIGDHSSPGREFGYALNDYVVNDGTEPFLRDYNFLANAETLAWQGNRKFVDPNGISGMDPMFVNEADPLGPDGLPFTEDDGLRPLPNSPLVALGAGALEPVAAGPDQPLAHFTITSISTGYPMWHDGAPADYNPGWFNLAPYQRTDWHRAWNAPESLGTAPVTVGLTATGSISGTLSEVDWVGIDEFTWDFGDGTTVRTDQPTVQHTFNRGGTHTVKLTIRNTLGAVHSTRKAYRVSGGDVAGLPSPPTNLQRLN